MKAAMEIPPVQPRHQQPFFPYTDYQARQDYDQLNMLAVLNLVYAILGFVGSLFVIAYGSFMETMFTNPRAFGLRPGRDEFPPPGFAAMMMIFMVISAVVGIAMAVLSLYASKCLRERRNWTWVMVAGCVNCIHVPLGTLLGVFTIIVINRPTVKSLFTAGR